MVALSGELENEKNLETRVYLLALCARSLCPMDSFKLLLCDYTGASS